MHDKAVRGRGNGECKGSPVKAFWHIQEQGEAQARFRTEEQSQGMSEGGSGARSGRGLIGQSKNLDLILSEMESH